MGPSVHVYCISNFDHDAITTIIFALTFVCSAQDAASVKKVVREFLSFVRGSSPLQLSLEHLTSLARHFKKRVRVCMLSESQLLVILLTPPLLSG